MSPNGANQPVWTVVTAVYPGAEAYFPECLKSLEAQSDRDFCLVVADAGMPGLEEQLQAYSGPVRVRPASGTPARVRKAAIAESLATGAEWLVFLDADDIAETNRIEALRVRANDSDVLFNDLVMFGAGFKDPASMLSGRFRDGDTITLDKLNDGNCLGLSNTAARAHILAGIYQAVPDDVVAVDWALFSLALGESGCAVYVGNTSTWYRQHAATTVSATDLSEARIRASVAAKARHYAFLADHDAAFAARTEQFTQLARTLERDTAFASRYCAAIREIEIDQPLWWERIKPREELNL